MKEFSSYNRKWVNNDSCGNPRIVLHFSLFLTDEERNNSLDNFSLAKKRANKLGGSSYRGRDFGGGFAFQCWSERELLKDINAMLESLNK